MLSFYKSQVTFQCFHATKNNKISVDSAIHIAIIRLLVAIGQMTLKNSCHTEMQVPDLRKCRIMFSQTSHGWICCHGRSNNILIIHGKLGYIVCLIVQLVHLTVFSALQHIGQVGEYTISTRFPRWVVLWFCLAFPDRVICFVCTYSSGTICHIDSEVTPLCVCAMRWQWPPWTLKNQNCHHDNFVTTGSRGCCDP